MAMPVVSVAAGGIAVIEVPNGMPITEAVTGRGVPVTKVVGKPYGLPVKFVSETGGAVTPPFAVWDSATAAAVTLSGSNLVVTSTGSANEQGAHVAAVLGQTAGKYYFEVTGTNVASAGSNMAVGIGTPSSTYTSMGNGGAVTGDMVYVGSGNIYASGSFTSIAIGAIAVGNIVGMAVDLDNRKIWFRKAPSGNWNNSGTANPATNTGGIAIPAGTMVPFCTFGGAGGTGNIFTANFGASAFAGAVPAGFTAGWPA